MAKRDAFIEDFKKLLEKIPDDFSLPQWQFAYRQVNYFMGMKILQNFGNDVVGPDPSNAQDAPRYSLSSGNPQPTENPAGGGGQSGGGHPSTVCEFVCFVLGVKPPATKPPPAPG